MKKIVTIVLAIIVTTASIKGQSLNFATPTSRHKHIDITTMKGKKKNLVKNDLSIANYILGRIKAESEVDTYNEIKGVRLSIEEMKKLNGGSSIISDNVLVHVREKLNEENSFWIPLYAYKEKYLNDLKEDITIVIGLTIEGKELQSELQAEKARKIEEVRLQREAREAELKAEQEAREAELKAEQEAREAELKAEQEAREAKLKAEREAELKKQQELEIENLKSTPYNVIEFTLKYDGQGKPYIIGKYETPSKIASVEQAEVIKSFLSMYGFRTIAVYKGYVNVVMLKTHPAFAKTVKYLKGE